MFRGFEGFEGFRGFLTPLLEKFVWIQIISGALNFSRVSSVLRVSGVSWV